MKKIHNSSRGWGVLFRIGAFSALVPFLLGLIDIALTFHPAGSAPDPGTGNIQEWFALLNSNWFLGLRGLGFFNVVISAVSIPLYLSLYKALKPTRGELAGLTLAVFLLGAGIYIANNPALAMLGLSRQFAAAVQDTEAARLLSAGHALLAKGEDFTPGSFTGFMLTELAGVMISALMLTEDTFTRFSGWLGTVGFGLLLGFTIWATFIPNGYSIALLFASVGGLLSIAWYISVAQRMFTWTKEEKDPVSLSNPPRKHP